MKIINKDLLLTYIQEKNESLFKFIRNNMDLKKIQKEINDDSVGYIISSDNKYKKIIVYLYNNANIPIKEKYIKDLEKNGPIYKVLVSPGISNK